MSSARSNRHVAVRGIRHLPFATLSLLGVLILVTGVASASTDASRPSRVLHPVNAEPVTVAAQRFAKVASLDPPGPQGHVTVLEGPAFGPDGELYMVHPTAPAGQAKVLALNLSTRKVRAIYSDAKPPTKEEFVSLQFNPADHKMFLTDIYGAVDRMNPNGTGFTTVLSGNVLGHPWSPDDIAFDRSGAMFVTDLQGTP